MSFRHMLTASSMLVAATGLSAWQTAMAQEAATATIEEIIVTATKRAQTLQDVPIAVSAYSAEQIKNSGITDLRELTQLSPSLFLSSSASEAAGAVARIRGVGTTGDNPGLESSVAVFVDGVYRNRTNIGLTELGELERVEVLRGPQGTLFGRNASAGLISITTKQPSFEFGANGELTFGNYSYTRIALGVTGPLVEDKVAARVDYIRNNRDGFLKDKVTGEDYNDRDRYLLRGQLLITPTDALSLRLIADYASRDENCCAATTIVRGPTAGIIEALGGVMGSGGSSADPDPFSRRSATTPGRGFQQDVKEQGVSAELNWDMNWATFTSITAYRDWQNFRSQDLDFSSADILYRDTDGWRQQFKTFSQEARLNGQAGFLDWLLGFYYANEKLALDDRILLGAQYGAYADALVRLSVPSFPGYGLFRPFVQAATGSAALASLAPAALLFPEGSGVAQDQFRQTSDNWALFTHNIINVTDAIDLTLGLRYTEERKTLDASIATNNQACSSLLGFLNNPAVPGAVRQALGGLATLPCLSFFNPVVDGDYDGRRKESELSGTVAVNVKWDDDVATYASYSRGYKAGGFNLDRAALSTANPNADADLQFKQETVDAFELGAKLRSPGRSVNLNAALFYSRFEDFQLNTFNGISYVVENLPKVTTKGVELEGSWQATEYLNFSGGLTYAQTEYGKDLGTDPIFAPPSQTNRAGGALWQLPGQQITNAPKWTMTGAASYEHPLTETLLALLYLDFRYTGKLNTGSDLDLEKVQEGVFIVNGRLGLGNIDRNWRIELWSRNIFDKDYIQIAFDAPLQGSGTVRNTILANTQTYNAFLAEPRTFGITLRGEF
ncbi:MAG: TonB-dependent receptor [Pseudomonadota bacterium]